MLFIYNQQLWVPFLHTLSLIILASVLSICMGVPLGILMAKSKRLQVIVLPVLDFMQTMPAFVYLIPAVAFFGIGIVPGIFASVIFALPPTVRFTNLGLRQVPGELIEAAEAFGCTEWQKLVKVDFIKIDVEGNEMKTLFGAKETILKFKPTVMVEIEQRHHQEPVWNLISEVENWGFEAHYLERNTFELKRLTEEFIKSQNAIFVKDYENYINNIIFIPQS